MTLFAQATASLYRAIVDTAVDAILAIDDSGKIRSANHAAEKLFGYEAADLIGRNIRVLMPAPFAANHDGFLESYRHTGVRKIIGIGREVFGLRRDASVFPMELSVGEAWEGEQRFFVGIVRDITQRKSTDKQLQDLQAELLHLSRLSTAGQMASTLAHELNQPLTAVMNFADATLKLMGSPHPADAERSREMLAKVIAQADRAGQIIQRLRGFVAHRQTHAQREAIGLVVEEASALALVGAGQFGIQVNFELDPDVPPVMIDKVPIQQVVLNIVRNAVEAMADSEERRLVIATRARPLDRMAEVSVSDTGPGIDENIAARLFQPFLTTKPTGMGLGLSICREIVEAHFGQIWASARPGGGTIFHFTVPVMPAEDDEHAG